jgi:dTDP-4-amino-4,6-dideoxygalactose transaminase
MRDMEISEADAVKAVIEYIARAQNSRHTQMMHLSGTGAVNELEEKLKRHYSMKYAVCVTNATTGLMAIALALNLRDVEFVTTPYTYGATMGGWLLWRNKPIFADVESSTLTLDCESVKNRITPKTRAILVADIFGNPHDAIGLRKIADEYDLWYISDSAQSLGAYRDNLPSGSLADAAVVSFTVGKTVFAGEGAAILTNNSDLYQKLLWFTQHPIRQRKELGLNLYNEFGLNARIHPIAAIWANATFEDSLAKLKSYQKRYFRLITILNETGFTAPIHFARDNIVPSFYKLSAQWKNKKNIDLAEALLLQELKSRDCFAEIEAIPVNLIYKQPAFMAQYGKYLNMNEHCLKAEKHFEKGFCLTIVEHRS